MATPVSAPFLRPCRSHPQVVLLPRVETRLCLWLPRPIAIYNMYRWTFFVTPGSVRDCRFEPCNPGHCRERMDLQVWQSLQTGASFTRTRYGPRANTPRASNEPRYASGREGTGDRKLALSDETRREKLREYGIKIG